MYVAILRVSIYVWYKNDQILPVSHPIILEKSNMEAIISYALVLSGYYLKIKENIKMQIHF